MHKFQIHKNLKTLPLFCLFNGFGLFTLIQLLYFKDILETYTLATLMISIYSISAGIFEVPTGIFSDKFGRKKSLICGITLNIISMILFFHAEHNPLLILTIANIIYGLGYSFISETDEAIIYETMKQLKREKKYPIFYGKIKSINQASQTVSAIISSYIAYKYSFKLVILINLIPLFINLIITSFLIEPVETKKNENNGNIKESIKAFNQNDNLKLISLSKIISVAIGDTAHKFETLYFASLVPLWMIGVIRAFKQLNCTISFWISGFIIGKYGDKKTLFTSRICFAIIKIISLSIKTKLAPFIYASSNLFYGLYTTSTYKLMQKDFANQQRATMSSIVAFLGSLTSGLFIILIGYVADLTNVTTAILITILPIGIILAIYNKLFKNSKIS